MPFRLIDYAVSHHKTPLNLFKPDPLNRSRLICKLTGDTVNKSEEHVWKHLNGKRFLNKLEQMERGKLDAKGEEVKKADEDENGDDKKEKNKNKNKKKKKKKKKDEKQKGKEEIISEVRDSADKDSDSEEGDFWVPPVGERWDFDEGGDRWGSSEEGVEDNDAVEDSSKESEELSKRTKRMSIEIGPSSFASRKKKSKKNPAS